MELIAAMSYVDVRMCVTETCFSKVLHLENTAYNYVAFGCDLYWKRERGCFPFL